RPQTTLSIRFCCSSSSSSKKLGETCSVANRTLLGERGRSLPEDAPTRQLSDQAGATRPATAQPKHLDSSPVLPVCWTEICMLAHRGKSLLVLANPLFLNKEASPWPRP